MKPANRRAPAADYRQATAKVASAPAAKANGSQNRTLNEAGVNRDDEFYTPRQTIENELRHYKSHFAGKRILCNCDDPAESEFFKFFDEKFGEWQLAKLTGTHYAKSPLFPEAGKAHYKVITPESCGRRTPLKGNGDFLSPECIKLLDEADIVVTNPPFSLFRKFIAELMGRHKKFIIIGNINAITYKEFFPLIRDGEIWMGATKASAHPFMRPEAKPPEQLGIACWFTNLSHSRREREKIILTSTYSPEKYPRYDNYPAIEVGKTKDIPDDYPEEMGVPISFLDKHNPEQFEIVGLCWLLLRDRGDKDGMFKINGKRKYRRIIIKHKGCTK